METIQHLPFQTKYDAFRLIDYQPSTDAFNDLLETELHGSARKYVFAMRLQAGADKTSSPAHSDAHYPL
jgi:hypothetical protein